MFWTRKPKPSSTPDSLVAEYAPAEPSQSDPAEELKHALRRFEMDFYEKTSGVANEDARRARDLVNKATKFVEESGLGVALSRSLLNHVVHWPSWSKREDFSKYCSDPFGYLDGGGDRKDMRVAFTYNGKKFEVKLNWSHSIIDGQPFGNISFCEGDRLVLEMTASQSISGDADQWIMSTLETLQPGDWMKDLIEMAAYIEGLRVKGWREKDDAAILKRAKNIKLPE